MRHYFSTQQELFLFSMNLIQDRIKERMTRLPLNGSTEENVLTLLEQVLPLDEERRFEMEVWQAFTMKSLTEPELQPLNAKMYDELLPNPKRELHSATPSLTGFNRCNLSEFSTTDTELKAIATPASHGTSNPNAATGIPIQL